jgi:pantoate kinase
METLIFKVSGKVMAKFCKNPDLDQKVQFARNLIQQTGQVSDSHNS